MIALLLFAAADTFALDTCDCRNLIITKVTEKKLYGL